MLFQFSRFTRYMSCAWNRPYNLSEVFHVRLLDIDIRWDGGNQGQIVRVLHPAVRDIA